MYSVTAGPQRHLPGKAVNEEEGYINPTRPVLCAGGKAEAIKGWDLKSVIAERIREKAGCPVG